MRIVSLNLLPSLMLLLLLVVSASLAAYADYGSSVDFSGFDSSLKTLADYRGAVFRLYSVKRITPLNGTDSLTGIIRYDELNDWILDVMYLITNNPASVRSGLVYKGYSIMGYEKIYVYEKDYNGEKLVIAVGDHGHFYIRLGSGEASVYQSCNISFTNFTENILAAIMGRLPEKQLKIVWKGQYGEKTAYMMTESVCYLVGNATVCSTLASRSVEKIVYNPYEVYYIYLDGYRIEPPIRVRCCSPSYNNGLSTTYVEGFIPTLGREVFEVKLDDKYMNEIMSLIKQAEPRATNYDELVV